MGLVFKMVNGWEIFGKLTLSSHWSEQSRRYSNLHEKEKKKRKRLYCAGFGKEEKQRIMSSATKRT